MASKTPMRLCVQLEWGTTVLSCRRSCHIMSLGGSGLHLAKHITKGNHSSSPTSHPSLGLPCQKILLRSAMLQQRP